MRCLTASWSAVVPLLALAVLPGCGKEHAEKDVNTRYQVTYEHEGKAAEKTFDLKKPADEKALADLLRRGEVEHIAQDKPPDLLAIQWETGLWTIVVFLLLYLILRRVAWGPMLEGLHKREQSILTAIEDAQKARAEAERLHEEWNKRMATAEDKVREILDEARRTAERTTEEMIAKARSEIQGERARLRREIDTAKDQALQEIWNQTAQLATEVSAKAIRRQITIDDQRRLIEEALAELHSRGKEYQRQVAGVRA